MNRLLWKHRVNAYVPLVLNYKPTTNEFDILRLKHKVQAHSSGFYATLLCTRAAETDRWSINVFVTDFLNDIRKKVEARLPDSLLFQLPLI